MPRFPLDCFKYRPPRFIPMEALLAHLTFIQPSHHRLKQSGYFLQPIGEGALGQGYTVMLELFT